MATEILRPNAAGDETSLTFQFPTSGEHWDKVNTVNDATRVGNSATASLLRDLYNLPSHSSSGVISKITVFFRCYSNQAGNEAAASIKSGSTVADGAVVVIGTGIWTTSSQEWALTNATAIATSHGEVGMCVVAANSDATGTLLMSGMIRADDEFDTFTAGSDIFLSSATPGKLSDSAPTGTTDFVVRIVASAPTADSISFNGNQAYATLV